MRKTALIFFASLGLISCESSQKQHQAEIPSVPVLTALPAVKNIPVYIESIGALRPSIFMEIVPQVNGTILETLISEGQWVEPGAPLFKIDPKLYAIKVHEAEAQLAINRAAFASAQKKLERYQRLAQKDLVAQIEWDDLETEAEKARAMVELDQTRLDAAKLDLERCTILSPIAGRVGKLDANPGLLVASGQSSPLATISQMDPLIVEFTVTEKEFPKLTQDNVAIEMQPLCSADDAFTTGMITFIDNHFDPKTGQILVRGNIPNSQYHLKPGQNVRVRTPIATQSSVTLIPQKAIRYNQEGPYIYIVLPDGVVGFRQLLLGDEQGNDVIVVEGVSPLEPVITDGHLRLFPGLKVEIKS